MCTIYYSQEVYISKVKALLEKELHVENGSHVDGVEQNGKTNGLTNGSHNEEEVEDVTMDMLEGEEAVKSPTAPKGKGGRRSKANSDGKSQFLLLMFIMEKQNFQMNEPRVKTDVWKELQLVYLCRVSSQYPGYKEQWETANYYVHVL